MSNSPTKRISPKDVPAEAVERVVRTRLLPDYGDVLIDREPAGWSTASSMWRYALKLEGAVDGTRHFARYDTAAMEGEQLANRKQTRLLYVEDGTASLLVDYRPSR